MPTVAMMPQTAATNGKKRLAMPPNGESTMEGMPRGRWNMVWVPPSEREKKVVLKGKPPVERAVFANRRESGPETIAVEVAEKKIIKPDKTKPKEDEAGDFAREGIMRSFDAGRAPTAFRRSGVYTMG